MIEAAEWQVTQPLLLQLLQRKGWLDANKLEAIRAAQQRDNEPIEEAVVRTGSATDRDIARLYAEHLCLPLFEPEQALEPLDRALGQLLPEKLCRDRLIVPISRRDDVLDIALATPVELLLVGELQLLTNLEVRPNVAAISVIEALIGSLYHGSSWPGADLTSVNHNFEEDGTDEEVPNENDNEEVVHLDQPPPPGRDGRIIRLVNQIFEQAFRLSASDIHLEPTEDGCCVRLRVDGGLSTLPPPPPSLFIPIISRIKVLAKMDIAEKRLPQDGAIALKSGDRRMDLRVNSVPTVYGEKLVLRILDKRAIPSGFDGLGLDTTQARDLSEVMKMPHGLMLITGPTGSGKSTTLYTCLNLLNAADKNICTVEDPVEYKFKGLNQVQVKSAIGFNFAMALRAFLRQDPDIIMVGEIRDQETAEICLRAALTGHFVLSSLHTNDALSALDRLIDLGVEPFLIASTLRLVEAQRLLRRLCSSCRQPYAVDDSLRSKFNLSAQQLFRAVGCDQCRHTGYRGRVGVFEVLRIGPSLGKLIQVAAPTEQLRATAREQGFGFLWDSALAKAIEGVTSLEQALTVATIEH
jgi:type IV pilus assembly protein PilB